MNKLHKTKNPLFNFFSFCIQSMIDHRKNKSIYIIYEKNKINLLFQISNILSRRLQIQHRYCCYHVAGWNAAIVITIFVVLLELFFLVNRRQADRVSRVQGKKLLLLSFHPHKLDNRRSNS